MRAPPCWIMAKIMNWQSDKRALHFPAAGFNPSMIFIGYVNEIAFLHFSKSKETTASASSTPRHLQESQHIFQELLDPYSVDSFWVDCMRNEASKENRRVHRVWSLMSNVLCGYFNQCSFAYCNFLHFYFTQTFQFSKCKSIPRRLYNVFG